MSSNPQSIVLKELEVLEKFLQEASGQEIKEAAKYIFYRLRLNISKIQGTNEEFLAPRFIVIFLTVKNYLQYQDIQLHYKSVLSGFRERVKNMEKMRVAFFVVYDCAFPARPLFEMMQSDSLFQPFIVIIPDTSRGEQHMFDKMESSYVTLSKAYPGAVHQGYDARQKAFVDFSDQADFVCTANPYDVMTHKYYTSMYLKDKPILCFFTLYGYSGRTKYEHSVFKMPFYSIVWRVFVESVKSLEETKRVQPLKGDNLVMTGYVKMDDMAKQKARPRTSKKIIIAPHHTVPGGNGELNLSQFVRYSDFFLELPGKYPDIDFVFRPHPLLFTTLLLRKLWTEEKHKAWLSCLTSHPNVIYDVSDSYFDTFLNSDGLIHDCGSFLAEYFYTPHPQCYLLRDEAAIDEEFLPFGKEMLVHTYKAFTEEQIVGFIDNVIVKGYDPMQIGREEFAKEQIRINYPVAAKNAMRYIKSCLE